MAVTGGTLAVALVSGAVAHQTQKRQAKRVEKAQKKQTDLEVAVDNQKASRARRQQVQQAQITAAQVENTAAVSGTSGSSAVQVGGESAAAGAGRNVGTINQNLASGQALAGARQDVFDAGAPTLGETVIGSVAGGISQQAAGAAGQKVGRSLFN